MQQCQQQDMYMSSSPRGHCGALRAASSEQKHGDSSPRSPLSGHSALTSFGRALPQFWATADGHLYAHFTDEETEV